MDILEKDWKMYKKMMPIWQECYIDKLNKKYIQILSEDNEASNKFWQLHDQINNDKKSIGVVVNYKRNQLIWQLIDLVNQNIISRKELSCFSDELRNEIDSILIHNTSYNK